MKLASACFWGCLALACGSSSTPSAYQASLDRATQAERQDDYVGAHDFYRQAATQAESDAARDEALYRQAALSLRQGDQAEAARTLLAYAEAHPQGARAARAWLDAGRAFERAGQIEEARRAYRHVVSHYPRSSGADAAASRWVALTPGAASDAWRQLVATNRDATLEPGLRYGLARALEPSDERAALEQYEKVAVLDPLPQGTHSDEALLRAAALRRKLGDPRGALAVLGALLESRSESFLAGSYERSAYAEARLLEARIWRDDLHDLERAAQKLSQLAEEHPQSRLLDDALFERAWTLALAERTKPACEALQRIDTLRPDSRFAHCGALYCAEASQSLGSHCCSALPDAARPAACAARLPE